MTDFEQQMDNFFNEHGGVVSVSNSPDLGSRRERGAPLGTRKRLRRLGSVFAFDRDGALDCADELQTEDADDEEDTDGAGDGGDDEPDLDEDEDEDEDEGSPRDD